MLMVLAPRSVASSAVVLSVVWRCRRCLAVVFVTVGLLELALLGLAEAQLVKAPGRFVSCPW